MWKQTTLGSPWLGHQSGPANAGHPKYDKQAPRNNAKYKQRKIKSHNRHHQQPRYPGPRWPITVRHPGHDPPAPRGQRRAHNSRPAPVEPDPPGHVSQPRCCPANGRPQPLHFCPKYVVRPVKDTSWPDRDHLGCCPMRTISLKLYCLLHERATFFLDRGYMNGLHNYAKP